MAVACGWLVVSDFFVAVQLARLVFLSLFAVVRARLARFLRRLFVARGGWLAFWVFFDLYKTGRLVFRDFPLLGRVSGTVDRRDAGRACAEALTKRAT
jgi:hypothetical protein